MRLSDFDFHLPEERIALRPASPREAARLLVVQPGGAPELADRTVADLVDQLRAGDALVFNDTKVIRARLRATRRRGDALARLEIMLHQRVALDRWRVFARPAKKLQIGETIAFEANDEPLGARVLEKSAEGDVLLEFDRSGPELDRLIALHGDLPLPPYIAGKRAPDERDDGDYQTVYAREEGAVAAPTAGLHFTPALLKAIEAKGVSLRFVTLHVGAGTFLPVKVEHVDEHRMHAEWGEIDPETAERLSAIRASGGRIVAVGTTSARLLESAAADDGTIRPFSGETRIFIKPGYRFKATDVLMTNFHLPKSTLFMLVSAFCGASVMRRAYEHAIASGYRFYSYGDASLLFRGDASRL
ncbi:MAG: tRNA preQ1(34) S-adenosylmethionine ribosyltransferase-isomerase QueA [Beijerinckiaceae bacterium]|nr:tRNA preQ1(34) S-adenosylmethionine ribosyltransferase-isomerase QueA [Beijerinckiaceae bacterium]